VIGFVSAASSAAAAFASSGPARDVLVAVAAVTAILLAYSGGKAHERMLELSRELVDTKLVAHTARERANEPVWDRQLQEQYEMFVKPMDEAVKRALGRVIALVRGSGGASGRA
jgi:hypothetical protein